MRKVALRPGDSKQPMSTVPRKHLVHKLPYAFHPEMKAGSLDLIDGQEGNRVGILSVGHNDQ